MILLEKLQEELKDTSSKRDRAKEMLHYAVINQDINQIVRYYWMIQEFDQAFIDMSETLDEYALNN